MTPPDVPPLRGLRVDRERIVHYLLDPTHSRGGAKAKFLLRFGFGADRPDVLAEALVRHYADAPDVRAILDAFGSTRIVCEGPIRAPDGRDPRIRSVWLVEADAFGRLLTVVPRPRKAL